MPDNIPDVCGWMTKSRDRVLNDFFQIPRAFSDGEDHERFVYIPGNRPDRVLLVAHADTVWGNCRVSLSIKDGVITSLPQEYEKEGKKHTFQIGIGGDDRAGCCMLWRFKDLGHSLLITSGEEKGCIAAKRIIESEWWKKELNDTHHFAIEFDRRGEKDIVFYDLATEKFAEYVTKETGYVPAQGFSTDIRHLCKSISAVNISVGYNNEHSDKENLVLAHFEKTYEVVYKWLSQKDLPKFPSPQNFQEKFVFRCYHNNGHGGNSQNFHQKGEQYPTTRESYPGSNGSDYAKSAAEIVGAANKKATTYKATPRGLIPLIPDQNRKIIDPTKLTAEDGSSKIVCRSLNCDNVIEISVWAKNQFRCPKCQSWM